MFTLEHSKWDSYVRTQQMRQLRQKTDDNRNTADETITIEHSRWDSHNRTQQMKQSRQNTDETVTLEHSKQNTADGTVTLETADETVTLEDR